VQASRRHPRLQSLVLALTLSAGFPGAAFAATFTVSPTQVYLSSKVTSALITLRNESQEPLRFQLTMRAWAQQANGEMLLTPTQDVLFFPQLLTLAPAEERKVRVGLAPGLKAGPVERTYRVFVEELPPSEAQQPTQGVRVLTKMGIPVFLQPAAPAARPALAELEVAAGRASFVVSNQGNAHYVPDSINVEGITVGGGAAFAQEVKGWYILAGGSRRFDVELPRSGCEAVTAVRVTMHVGATVVNATAETPSGPCRQP
jgi:fimbrial chaperone protein